MQVGDYFKINSPRSGSDIVYQVMVVTSDSEWVSAKVVYPATVAEKLSAEGVFRIHVASLGVTIIGNINENSTLRAIYG